MFDGPESSQGCLAPPAVISPFDPRDAGEAEFCAWLPPLPVEDVTYGATRRTSPSRRCPHAPTLPIEARSTGGACWERPEHRRTRRQWICPTVQVGLAALMSGQYDLADVTFEWFDRLWSTQPSLPDRLYQAWGPEGLVTDVEPGEPHFEGKAQWAALRKQAQQSLLTTAHASLISDARVKGASRRSGLHLGRAASGTRTSR